MDRFVAIRPGGRDNATESHVVWETSKGLAEMASPLFYRGRVFVPIENEERRDVTQM